MLDSLRVAKVAQLFPAEFGLAGFAGDRFRVSVRNSYLSNDDVVLYLDMKSGERWVDFCKGSYEELVSQVVK